MLAQCEIVGFIPTVDSNRARAFYVDKLRLQLISDDQFALVVRAGHNNIRIAKVDAYNPLPFTLLGWEVPDIEQAAKELASVGIVFEKYPWVPNPSGIWSAPSGAKVAWFRDPDSNLLSISQHPESTTAHLSNPEAERVPLL
jgi:catechol 2,3-dioxygenase-like lactoylglutathione lyase family enzyme